jgi:hypothetical protein
MVFISLAAVLLFVEMSVIVDAALEPNPLIEVPYLFIAIPILAKYSYADIPSWPLKTSDKLNTVSAKFATSDSLPIKVPRVVS